MNAVAGGRVYPLEIDRQLLFSTGHTAGPDIPSEAAAMRDYMLSRGLYVPPEHITLEEKSNDTATNAMETAHILEARGINYSRIDLLSVGFHLRRATKLFKNFGVPIEEGIASEDVLKEYGDPEFEQGWAESPSVRAERRKELIGHLLVSTIDPNGTLLHKITARTRT